MTFQNLLTRLQATDEGKQVSVQMRQYLSRIASPSKVKRRAQEDLAKIYFATTVEKLLRGDEEVEGKGETWKLVQKAVEVLGGEKKRSAASGNNFDVLDAALRKGEKLRVGYEEGVFSARIGELIVDGATTTGALTTLCQKLSSL